ncbi:MAG: histidinol phosphate phosphatase domain-containing protein [Candidatus Aureabacteria bacterium]|nr:histidinol phosphate phosphatase domain-containing protein [Candidatus Auribacterota bacterium]
MIDFHTHSFLSDGDLIPSELAARAQANGYRALGIADHVDGSNADLVVPRLVAVCHELSDVMGMAVIAGVEITHVPPRLIGSLVVRCREMCAEYIIVHGETVVEPVARGTNDAALDAGADILAHPGMLTPAQARKAADRGILLELSARKGHCLTNGHVARCATAAGAGMIIGSDAHAPSDLLTKAAAVCIARGAGLTDRETRRVQQNAENLLKSIRNK